MLGKGGFARCYELVNLDTLKKSAGKVIPKSTLSKVRAKQKVLDLPPIQAKLTSISALIRDQDTSDTSSQERGRFRACVRRQ
jgi:hypothetical protein